MITAAQRVEHTNTMGSEEKADMINQMKGSKKEIIDFFFFLNESKCVLQLSLVGFSLIRWPYGTPACHPKLGHMTT